MSETKKKVMVMGDYGIDHVIVPLTHDPEKIDHYKNHKAKIAYLFGTGSDYNITSRVFGVDAGASQLCKILEGLDDRCLLTEKNIKEKWESAHWETYSRWLLCQTEEKKEDRYPLYSHGQLFLTKRGSVAEPASASATDESEEAPVPATAKSEAPYTSEDAGVFAIRDVYLNDKERDRIAQDLMAENIGEDKSRSIVLRTRIECNGDNKNSFEIPKLVAKLGRAAQSRTILLVGFEELKQNGAMLQDALSWDNVLEETAISVMQIKNYRDYHSIVVAFKGLGALLFVPSATGTGDSCKEDFFSLLFFENQIRDLSEALDSGRLFGNLTILHCALVYCLAGNFNENDRLQHLERGIASGIYASMKLQDEGVFHATVKAVPALQENDSVSLYEAASVEFSSSDAAKHIKECWAFLAKASDDGEIKCKFIPSVFRIKAQAFGAGQKSSDEVRHFNGSQKGSPYPFESILKETIYSKMKPGHFKVHTEAYDAKRLLHHLNKLTIKNPLALEGDPTIINLCKQIVRDGRIEDTGYDLTFEHSLPKSALSCAIPYLLLGDSFLYDSTEIKQVCDTHKLFSSYAKNRNTARKPCSICVFGKPGSGKSFLVEQIAESMEAHLQDEKPELLTFNLSQMNNPEDLVAALHKVRDSGLKGRLPFAFFDEFDSRLGTEDLGWLKYFLTPMQDGTFTDKQGHIHQTGRALFIFAGGTSSSMGEFKKGILLENGERDAAASISCKHPDFVSRIKGYINVMGPDGTRPGGMLHYFRRATLLRKMLERKFSVSGKDRIEIEDNVLTAFLKAEKYYNGSRSLQAIVELSDLPKHGPLRGSNIYLDDTLGLYVSPDFVDYLKGHLS